MSVQEIPPDYAAELREEVENSRMNSDVPLIEGEVGRVSSASINTRISSVGSARQRLLLASSAIGLSAAIARAAESDWFEPVQCQPEETSKESGEEGIRMHFSKKGSHKQNRRKALKRHRRNR